MKKITFVILFISVLFLKAERSFSWDSTIAKYMPLQVGNVWVYNSYSFPYGGSYKFKWSITGTNIFNGHLYYNILSSSTGVTNVRFDSLTNSLKYYSSVSCPWLNHEKNMDSLSSRLNDSSIYNCDMIYKCNDTTAGTIFNLPVRKKSFYYTFFEGYDYRSYAQNFGLVHNYSAGHTQTTYINIQGCVLNGVVYGDTSMLTGINQISSEVPSDFELYQNYPNPFNPSTKIKFTIPANQTTHQVVSTRIVVYDALGREVQSLVNQELRPGTYEVEFPARTGGDGANLPSGVYYYKLDVRHAGFTTGSFEESKKMLLIK